MINLPVNPLVNWGSRRIKKNKNILAVVNGPTGSGKTYATLSVALKFAKIHNTPFSIKNNLDFDFQRLNKKMGLPQNRRPGTVFVFEEVGAIGGGASSREWQSKANRLFFSFTQTSRHLNQILIMTCPSFKFLEYGARSLVHLQMNMESIDYVNREALLSYFLLQTNTVTGKIYFKRQRVIYKGVRHKIKYIKVPHPPEDLAKEYEKAKKSYSNSLKRQISESKTIKLRSSNINTLEVQKLKDAGFRAPEIAKYLGVTPRAVNLHIQRNREEQKIGE